MWKGAIYGSQCFATVLELTAKPKGIMAALRFKKPDNIAEKLKAAQGSHEIDIHLCDGTTRVRVSNVTTQTATLHWGDRAGEEAVKDIALSEIEWVIFPALHSNLWQIDPPRHPSSPFPMRFCADPRSPRNLPT